MVNVLNELTVVFVSAWVGEKSFVVAVFFLSRGKVVGKSLVVLVWSVVVVRVVGIYLFRPHGVQSDKGVFRIWCCLGVGTRCQYANPLF